MASIVNKKPGRFTLHGVFMGDVGTDTSKHRQGEEEVSGLFLFCTQNTVVKLSGGNCKQTTTALCVYYCTQTHQLRADVARLPMVVIKAGHSALTGVPASVYVPPAHLQM